MPHIRTKRRLCMQGLHMVLFRHRRKSWQHVYINMDMTGLAISPVKGLQGIDRSHGDIKFSSTHTGISNRDEGE